MKRGKKQKRSVVPADPSQWSQASQRSVSAEWTREYRDIEYACRRCHASAIFTAEDQKYTFEVKKAPIDQQRVLCANCWSESNRLAQEIELCEEMWAKSKTQLSSDRDFLSKWLGALQAREAFVPYRPNTAAKNMLSKLLAVIAEQSVAADRPKKGSG